MRRCSGEATRPANGRPRRTAEALDGRGEEDASSARDCTLAGDAVAVPAAETERRRRRRLAAGAGAARLCGGEGGGRLGGAEGGGRPGVGSWRGCLFRAR